MENSLSESDKIIYRMPEGLRSKLAAPIGKVLSSREDILKEISGSEMIITVGDIVTLNLLEWGAVPDLSIVDYMTKREQIHSIRERFSRFIQSEARVDNPQGTITQGLWDLIDSGIREPRKLRIVVYGEEDLASLACIALAPENTIIIYGIPNRGASVHRVNKELKALVNETLELMRVPADN